MEISIPDWLIERAHEFSASRFELGNEAPRLTWRAAMLAAQDWRPHAVTVYDDEEEVPEDELLSHIRHHFREYGAWEPDEIDSWTRRECIALLIQEAASAARELERLDIWDEDGELDHEKNRKAQENGEGSGRAYYNEHGLYLSLGP